jgi:SagB-type dehydrogenase family enzyme
MSAALWDAIVSPLGREDLGWELFHESAKATRHTPPLPDAVAAAYTRQIPESLAYDAYPKVELPQSEASDMPGLDHAIESRLLVDSLERDSVDVTDCSAVLRHSYGPVGATPEDDSRRARAVFSPGCQYPLELFVHCSRVDGLPPGLYHYSPPTATLRRLREGDYSNKLASCMADGDTADDAAFMIFIAVMPERSTFRYGDRGYRFALLEAGAVVQNINLVASSLGLACVNTGDYFDRDLDEIFFLDGLTISIIFVMALGKALTRSETLGAQSL